MAKIDPNFQHDIFTFLHRPLRLLDVEQGDNFLERFLIGPQAIFEQISAKREELKNIKNPAKTRADLLVYLKDHVGFTKELNNITQDLTEADLRKLISVGIPIWNEKGTEPGYQDIVRIFTGKSVRVFNWFDFRLIVGEKAFGEEQLGEDSWLISVPGVEASQDPSNNVVCLLTFEGNLKDRSLTVNHGTASGPVSFFQTPPTGFPQGSHKYAKLEGGVISLPNSSKYDLSGSFTIELFLRIHTSQVSKTVFYKKDFSGKGIEITVDSAANSISFELNDGVNIVSDTLTPIADIDDGQPRHLALAVNRTLGARLYYGGVESTPLVPLGPLGSLTNTGQIIVGGSGLIVNNILADIDNVRLALNSVYLVTNPTLTVPLTGFIEYVEERLDEFFSDVRIVDEGDLNKVLMLRILNLMRPSSERLNAIFIRFFEDFSSGSGRFVTLVGSSTVNVDRLLEIAPNSTVVTDVLGDEDFKDLVLQVKANDTLPAGGVFSVLFFFQDLNNFYEYRVDTVNRELSLHKKVGGVTVQIGAPVPVDIVPEASYIFTIQTSFDSLANDTLLQTFFDSNRIHSLKDAAFQKGKFGFKTSGSTTMQTGEIEMFQIPMDVRQVLPGFNL